MQDRYAGDVGDYVKLALLRALGAGENLGVAWYLYPDESHNSDGNHCAYLQRTEQWRHLDPELFDALHRVVSGGRRSVAALMQSGVLGDAVFSAEAIDTREHKPDDRCAARAAWFDRTCAALDGCSLVFADPDNGLIDDAPHRRRDKTFGKQMPLSEALALADGRTAVIYHHNTRFRGGHDLEVRHWCDRLGAGTLALRANAWSCRTFFIVNPTPGIAHRAEDFGRRWGRHRVRLET